MKKFAKKFTLIAMAATMATMSLVGCGSDSADKGSTNGGTTSQASGSIIVGTSPMNGVFNPFFATTAYDMDIVDRTQEPLIKPSPTATPQANLADYKIEEVLNEDGSIKETVYTFTLKEGVKFSDGTAITAEDILFTYHVLADPTYDGSSVFRTKPIVGMQAYTSGDAATIEGITKVDDRSVQVRLEGVDPTAIWDIGAQHVASKAYYGEGYSKGNLEAMRALNNAPMGAGAYKFEKFENNVVSLVANENYFLGEPKTAKIKYQVMATANKLEAVKMGEVDISDPNANPDMIAQVDQAGYHKELVDFAGYGYVGMNADRITDVNVRKGLMHLMNRKPAVEAYYGDYAKVIERPMSDVIWAYPEDATEFYGFNPEKALECFKAAGYEQDASGKLMKDGKQLRIEVGIPADGKMDHPTAPVLTQMKTEMEKMGALLEIMDTDSTIFFDRLEAKEWDMFVAAWGNALDPDMSQIFHSEGPSNHYQVKSEALDTLIEAAILTNDIEERKAIYSDALDTLMDEAVIMPIYQRMDMFVFNQENIDIETLPANITAFADYFSEVHTMESLIK